MILGVLSASEKTNSNHSREGLLAIPAPTGCGPGCCAKGLMKRWVRHAAQLIRPRGGAAQAWGVLRTPGVLGWGTVPELWGGAYDPHLGHICICLSEGLGWGAGWGCSVFV